MPTITISGPKYFNISGFNETVQTFPTDFSDRFNKSIIFEAISNIPNSILPRQAKHILKILLFKYGRKTGILIATNDTLARLSDKCISATKKILSYLYKKFPRFIISTIYHTGKFKNRYRRQINIHWRNLLIYIRGLVRKVTGERDWFYFPKTRDRFLKYFQGGSSTYLKQRSCTLNNMYNNNKKLEIIETTSPDAPSGASTDDFGEEFMKKDSPCKQDVKNSEKTLPPRKELLPVLVQGGALRRPKKETPLLNYSMGVAKRSQRDKRQGNILRLSVPEYDENMIFSGNLNPTESLPKSVPFIPKPRELNIDPRPIQKSTTFVVDENNPEDVRNMFIRSTLKREDLQKILDIQGINKETLERRMRANLDYNPQQVDHLIPWNTECNPAYALLSEDERNWKFSEIAAKWLGADCRYFSSRTKTVMVKARKMADEAMADYNDWCAAQYRIKKKNIMNTHFCSRWARQNYDKYIKEGWNEPEFVGCNTTQMYRSKARSRYVSESQWWRNKYEEAKDLLGEFLKTQEWGKS